MAAKPEIPPPPPANEAGAPKKKRFKLILIAGIALLLVVVIAVAAFLLLSPGDEDVEEGEADSATAKVAATAATPPVFLEIDTFTVNLLSEGGDQYLQLAVTLELAGAEVADKVRLYMPRLRNQVMLLLSGKKPADLATKEGKELLARELRDEINSVIAPAAHGGKQETPVKAVLFTSFIVQ